MPATVFDKPIFPGAKEIHAQLTVTNTSGSYTHTEQDLRIISAMSANRIEIADPSVFRDRISIVTANGSYTISCSDVVGETTVKISFLKIVDDQQFATSPEYDLLSNRIGDLSDLETTDQTSIVNAVNEVANDVAGNTQAIANKPDYASEMPISSSDATKVSAAIETKINCKRVQIPSNSSSTVTLPNNTTFFVFATRLNVETTSAEGIYIGSTGANNEHISPIGTAASALTMSLSNHVLTMSASTSNLIVTIIYM